MGFGSDMEDLEGPILIEGTRGTGKRSFARSLHANSSRQRKMFRVFNCRSCSPLEARRLFLGELHGNRRGTGRYIRYLGLLEEVAEGTLYLEEIEALSLDMQRILANAIREGEFCPIGCSEPIPFRGRVILATCSSAIECVKSGTLDPALVELVEAETIGLAHRRRPDSAVAG